MGKMGFKRRVNEKEDQAGDIKGDRMGKRREEGTRKKNVRKERKTDGRG